MSILTSKRAKHKWDDDDIKKRNSLGKNDDDAMTRGPTYPRRSILDIYRDGKNDDDGKKEEKFIKYGNK